MQRNLLVNSKEFTVWSALVAVSFFAMAMSARGSAQAGMSCLNAITGAVIYF